MKADSWCYDAVQLCYETGLLNGTSETTFSPNGNLSIAQLLVLTDRLYNLRQGDSGTIPSLPERPEDYARFLDSSGKQIAGLQDVTLSVDSNRSQSLDVRFQTPPAEKTLTLQVGFPGDGIEETLTGQFVAGTPLPDNAQPGIYFVTQDHYEFPVNGSVGAYRLFQALYAYQLSEADFPTYWGAWYYPAVYDLSYREAVFPVWGTHATTLTDVNASAWREDFAAFLGSVCADLEPLQNFGEIPDVHVEAFLGEDAEGYSYEQYAAIHTLYNAGILNGVDRAGTFHGKGTLTRAQAAAMLARVLDPTLRIKS